MISVIVPAYNIENYISKALDSILNQTYKNIEIIAVDDGSSDGTGKIIDEYAKLYSDKVIAVHTENKGVTNARITGIKKASGQWIGFVDGDDEAERDMYELLIKNGEAYGADISHCGYKMVFDDSRQNYFYNTKSLVLQNNKKGITDLLEGKFVEPGLWNKLYKKELFNDCFIDTFNRSIKINEDLLMNYYLFKQSKKSVFCDECKYIYKIRGNSASRQSINKNKIYDPITVRQIILDDCSEEIKPTAKRIYMGTCINTYNYLVVENNSQYKDDKEHVRKMIYEEKNYFKFLGKKYRIIGNLILFLPCVYDRLYRYYVKHIQKSKYS